MKMRTSNDILHSTPILGVVSFWLGMAMLMCSCGSKADESMEGVLVTIGNARLTADMLNREIPQGINAEDSIKLASAYIKSWINSQLVTQVAAREIDMTKIDKMVNDYRNELIMYEYGRQMFDSHNVNPIPEDSIHAYYDRHQDDFKLSRPLVKGVYIKAADDAPELRAMSKLYKSHTQADIDQLDKTASAKAVHYDYFRDKWVDWEQIESRIPYDFGRKPDEYLSRNRSLEYSQGGFTYLLDITDVLRAGQQMPYEAARPQIIDRLTFQNRRTYDAYLKKNLYDNAIENGKITLYVDIN